ncbi:MAG: ABC transporter substrate-binding protein, partial [Nitrospiraceae bacterium]|nr:ABC transporter substrate-binding protein [Nitrospiraceae bacterium]
MNQRPLMTILAVSLLLGGISSAKTVWADETSIYPPWSHGHNNPSVGKGVNVTVPDVDNLPDLHGNMSHPELV